ncbi:Belongs to the CD36 [Homalodisca vitripennis]|nr:Belongs to the CD36 [Homalodisca vitripennis]
MCIRLQRGDRLIALQGDREEEKVLQITLRRGSQVFDLWRKPPVHPVMRIYIYNVTNADEFLSGSETPVKPILQELGPYTYM